MKGHCERPYQHMIAGADAVRHLPEHVSEWHVRRLAAELGEAAHELDIRMRAGQRPPQAWESSQRHDPHQ